jgi:hypothetical protein
MVLVALAACGGAACTELYSARPPEPAPAPAPPPPEKQPKTCASWKATGAPDTPQAAELVALLGKLESSPEVEKLMIRLGMSEVKRVAGGAVHTYRERGLQLFLRTTPSGGKVISVKMLGRDQDAKGYAGKLPDELSFAQTRDEAKGMLGKPDRDYCGYYGGCEYQSRGISFGEDLDHCLSWVELSRPLGEKQVRFEDVSLQENVGDSGVHGIVLGWFQTFPKPKGYKTPIARLCLDDPEGKPRKSPRWARSPHESSDELCIMARADESQWTTEHVTAFIPYAMLDQAPGPFALKGRLSAVLYRDSILSSDEPPRIELEPEGQRQIDFQATMLPLQRARVSVRRAEVEKGKLYDNVERSWVAAAIATGGVTALIPLSDRWKRPDLQWTVYLGRAKAFRSAAFQDVYSASWGGSSGPLPLAPDDRFSICLEDEDLGDSAERIGCFDFTLESYLDQVKSGRPLARDAVKKLVLGPATVAK